MALFGKPGCNPFEHSCSDKSLDPTTNESEDVDKVVAVVGGFGDKTVEELEALVEEMMRGV